MAASRIVPGSSKQDSVRLARPSANAQKLFALQQFSKKLSIGGRAVKLTKHELRFLHLLKRRRNGVVPRATTCALLWGDDGRSYQLRLDVLVTRLRNKLGRDGSLIETVRGLGHRLRRRGGGEKVTRA
jgi:DNA-binding response OmpR family regulator